jgi:phosphatidylglycerol:prolipoprotein diacylglycerol transferase
MNNAIVSIVHHPFELHVGPLPVTGFGVAMLLAFVIGQVASQAELARRGHDANIMADVIVAAVIGGLAGGKIYYAILTGSAQSLAERAGFVFWGGLAGGILAGWAVIRWRKATFPNVSDACALGLAAAYAVGRTGCWAVGDDYGTPWMSRFGVRFPEGSPPSTVEHLMGQFGQRQLAGLPPTDVLPVYPTQLFEVALGVVMFAVLWRLRDHKHAVGWLFGLYAVLAGAERFLVEFFRAKDDRFFGAFTLAQLIALGCLAAGAAWMYSRRNVRPGAPGIYAGAAVSR